MLKNFDYRCDACGRIEYDHIAPAEEKTFPCGNQTPTGLCMGTMERAWIAGSHSSSVHGDECDVTVKNGLCHPDGTPQRFTSKSEMKREAQKRGFSNVVTHIPGRGSDKSKHTQRFV
jgi:hypothetical protein